MLAVGGEGAQVAPPLSLSPQSPPSSASWPTPSWVQGVLESAAPLLPSMAPEHLGSLIWAASRLTAEAPPAAVAAGFRPSPSWMAQFVEAATAHEGGRRGDGGYYVRQQLLQQQQQQQQPRQQQPRLQQQRGFPVRALSNMLCALVDLQYRPTPEWLDQQFRSSLDPGIFSPHTLTSLPHDQSPVANSVAALGSLKTTHPEQLLAAGPVSTSIPHPAAAETVEVAMVDAVSLLCSCARLAHRPPPGVMRVLLGAAHRGLPSSTPSQAVELARALGGLGVLPSADWMSRWDALVRGGSG